METITTDICIAVLYGIQVYKKASDAFRSADVGQYRGPVYPWTYFMGHSRPKKRLRANCESRHVRRYKCSYIMLVSSNSGTIVLPFGTVLRITVHELVNFILQYTTYLTMFSTPNFWLLFINILWTVAWWPMPFPSANMTERIRWTSIATVLLSI